MMKKLMTIVLLFLVCTSVFSQEIAIEKAPAPLWRDPIFDGAADPTIIWNDQKQEWWIYYTQRRANQELAGVAYCYGSDIGIAASSNQGRSWRYVGTAQLPQIDQGKNTYWAPHVLKSGSNYHMFVTYISGVYNNWEGKARILHYKSKDLFNWKLVETALPDDFIDASVYQMPDKSWKMWYTKNSHTYTATSSTLRNWKTQEEPEITGRGHEAPIVFKWLDSYWMLTDPRSLGFTGMDVFKSKDATHWEFESTILDKPGKRTDDAEQGRHADVVVIGEKAYIVYMTHPGRDYDKAGIEIEENTWAYRRTSIQIAELELINGKLVCNRDKYFK